ncbi:MAG: DUF4389 domain-containing protein, partial [Actinomycetes bacterium]
MKKPAAIIMLILGILIALPGLGALAGGAAASAVGTLQGDGYLTSGTSRFTVNSYALTSPRADAVGEEVPGRLPFDVGTLRLRAESATPGKAVFIGIAPQAEVERYLSGVHHSELLNISQQPFRAEYRDVPGGSPASPPASQSFWNASVSGSGEQELTWNLAAGAWEIVVMNADASQGVDVRLQAGFHSDLFQPAATGLLVGGIIALVIGIPLIVFGAAGLGRHTAPPSGGEPTGGRVMAGPGYPGQGYPGQGYPGQGYNQAMAGAPLPGQSAPGSGQGHAGQGHAGPESPGQEPGWQSAPGPGTAAASWGQPGERATAAAAPASPFAGDPGGPAYPARLFGDIDPGLSRWMWLVQWFLAIPHFILLFFL